MLALINWLKRPYYFNTSKKSRFLMSIGFGSFVWLFLYFFEPFNIASLHAHLFYFTLGFGLITFSFLLIVFFAVPLIFKKIFDGEKWNVGKHFVLVFGSTLVISVLNWLYNSKLQDTRTLELTGFFTFIIHTASVGFIPVVFLLFTEELFFRKKNEKLASEITHSLKKNSFSVKESLVTEIIITTSNNNESLLINIKNVVYINSQGNYSCFFVLKDLKIVEKVLRIPLLEVSNQLKNHRNFVRCHKSYIINSNHFDAISGNARGYMLHSDKIDFLIPVSRKFKKEKLLRLIN